MTPFALVLAALGLLIGLVLGTAYGISCTRREYQERLKWITRRYAK